MGLATNCSAANAWLGSSRPSGLALTERGRALLARALPIWESEHVALEASLSPSDPERLRGDLRSLHA